MQRLIVITPVKDSWETTERTIDAILTSKTNFRFDYIVYNDYSNEINTHRLTKMSKLYHFELINIREITSHPPPNYYLTIQSARNKAFISNAHLLIIESDVIVTENTIQQLYDYAQSLENPGLIAAVTTDEAGAINFPYLYAKNYEKGEVSTRKRLSFCCTLITHPLLLSLELAMLNSKKDWFDIQFSRLSLRENFRNYLLTSCPVVHLPHSSRPWKQLKYTHPLKYYWLKITGRLTVTK